MWLNYLLTLIVVQQKLPFSESMKGFKEHLRFASPKERQEYLMQNVSNYEIVFPVITSSQYNHHSGHVSNTTSNGASDANYQVFYMFSFFNEKYFMELQTNNDLFGKMFAIEHRYEGKIEKSLVQKNCFLTGKTYAQGYQVAVSDCNGLLGAITTNSGMIFIEPLINDSYVNSQSKHGKIGGPHLVYKINKGLNDELDNIMKHSAVGLVKTVDNAVPMTMQRQHRRKRQISENNLLIKILNKSGRIVKLMWKHKNRLRKRSVYTTLFPESSSLVPNFDMFSYEWSVVDEATNIDLLLDGKRTFAPVENEIPQRKEVIITLPVGSKLPKLNNEDIRKNVGPKYIESLVVADKSMLDYHGRENIEIYIITLMNLVSRIMQHKSLGVDMNYVIVKLVLLHYKPREVKFNPAKYITSLATACKYLKKLRKGTTDKDPYYFDHGLYLTRDNFGPAAGYAYVHSMCSYSSSCGLNSDDGFPSSFIIAHEIGHSLGLIHDGEDNSCHSDARDGAIMGVPVRSTFNKYFWSSCSRNDLLQNIRTFRCLKDKPTARVKPPNEKSVPFLKQYPGFYFTLDDQCRLTHGQHSKFCRAFQTEPCVQLYCNQLPPYHRFCETTKDRALDGSKCGNGKICVDGKCVVYPDPNEIISEWKAWQKWGDCSKKCGVGIRERQRTCNNPSKPNSNEGCVGAERQQEVCNTQVCRYKVALRNDEMKKQCSLIRRKDVHTGIWSYYGRNQINPCQVHCISFPNQKIYFNQDVINGIRCHENNSKDICMDGYCLNVGCDDVIGSVKEYDSCGVCGGDGTSCKKYSGRYNEIPTDDTKVLLVVPKGYSNLMITKHHNTDYKLVLTVKPSLQSINEFGVINPGAQLSPPGIYYAAGSRYLYNISNGNEIIKSLGVVNSPVNIKIKKQRSTARAVFVNYKYYAIPTYSWETGIWSKCSKTCSTGIITRSITCVQIPGNIAVSRKYCTKIEKPKTRDICNLKHCSAKWRTGKWSRCSQTCGNGSQSRDVWCGDDRRRPVVGCDEKIKPLSKIICRQMKCSPNNIGLNCNFEKDLCHWKHVTKFQLRRGKLFKWKRRQGSTPSVRTGPSADHTLKSRKGYYLYTEASKPRRYDDKAMLISPEIASGRACLIFYYHMHGARIGKLKIRILPRGALRPEKYSWLRHRQQGNRWLKGQVEINKKTPYKIIFVGSIGRSYLGDIAIDDIKFYETPCSQIMA